MRKFSKVLALLLTVAILATFMVACGGNSDGGSGNDSAGGAGDIFKGTWKQTDEVNGDWTWTFDGAGKCTLVGDTTGFSGEGTYSIDEAAKTATVKIEAWDEEKVYDYTLDGDKLDLESKYSSYHLVKA